MMEGNGIRPTWSNSFTTGNVLTIIAMIVGGFGFGLRYEGRLVNVEDRSVRNTDDIKEGNERELRLVTEISASVRDLARIQVDLSLEEARRGERLSIIVERLTSLEQYLPPRVTHENSLPPRK